jgi:hypothetical protein
MSRSVVSFGVEGDRLYLIYQPTDGEACYLIRDLRDKGEGGIGRVFSFTRNKLISELEEDGQDYFKFEFGVINDGYVFIDQDVLGIEYSLAFSQSVELTINHFRAVRDISIFKRLNALKIDALFIGGDHANAVPEEVFDELVRRFPTTTEVTKYAEARISAILGNYLDGGNDLKTDYNQYLTKRMNAGKSKKQREVNPLAIFAEYETKKYDDLHGKLEDMLAHADQYDESDWQENILQIILLLFPRYIEAIPEVDVVDNLANTKRYVDFLLVDASGFIDVVEIKKPMEQELVTGHNRCRGNHVPVQPLSSAVMQLEKYLFHFNRSGAKGEVKLQDAYADRLPEGVKIKIVNPQGFIIMGREVGLSRTQLDDFEVIKRQYRNIVDIITYDDLLRRLRVIRDHFSSNLES